jgi:hypothetical protein
MRVRGDSKWGYLQYTWEWGVAVLVVWDEGRCERVARGQVDRCFASRKVAREDGRVSGAVQIFSGKSCTG